jgi:hypothetical protein
MSATTGGLSTSRRDAPVLAVDVTTTTTSNPEQAKKEITKTLPEHVTELTGATESSNDSPTQEELEKWYNTSLIHVVAKTIFDNYGGVASDINVHHQVSMPLELDGPFIVQHLYDTLTSILDSCGKEVSARRAIKSLIEVFYFFNLGVWFEYNGRYYGFESINEDYTGAVLKTVHFKLTEDGNDTLVVSHSIASVIEAVNIAFTIETSSSGKKPKGDFLGFYESLMI